MSNDMKVESVTYRNVLVSFFDGEDTLVLLEQMLYVFCSDEFMKGQERAIRLKNRRGH